MLKSTTPALSAGRETAYRQNEAPVQKPPRQAAFHEAIDMGMNPADALKKCIPSTTKAITKERLTTCLEAGLDVPQIGTGFGTSSANIYFQCAKHQIKLSQRKPTKKAVKPVDKPIAPEPAPIVELEPSTVLPIPQPLAVLSESVPVPKVWTVPEPVTVSASPAEPEFIWFDRREKTDTGVLIRDSGCIEISAAVSAGLTNVFVKVGISRDGTVLKIVLADGLLWAGNAGKRKRLNLKALVHKLQWAKIPLPARYIGTWQGDEWTGHLQEVTS